MPAPLANDPDDDANLPAPQGRCADIELESGEVLIYDVENRTAWIQSDGAVDLEALA